MKYWIEGSTEPLTRNQIHEQRDRLCATTRCAPVGVNTWRPISEVIPDLFLAEPPPVESPETPPASEPSPRFYRESGWPIFFYVLAALNSLAGLVIGLYISPLIGLLAGTTGCLVCLFFAFVSQLLVDIRWLLSRK